MLSKYSERLQAFCSDNNYSPVIIDSNMNDFYQGMTFQSTHTIRSSSAILAMGGAFSTFFYSSSVEYLSVSVSKTYEMAYVDPILLPLLSTEAIQFRAIGTNLSRR